MIATIHERFAFGNGGGQSNERGLAEYGWGWGAGSRNRACRSGPKHDAPHLAPVVRFLAANARSHRIDTRRRTPLGRMATRTQIPRQIRYDVSLVLGCLSLDRPQRTLGNPWLGRGGQAIQTSSRCPKADLPVG